MRDFARRLASGGLSRVERGPSQLQADVASPIILLILSSGSIAALALCLALFAWLTPSWLFAVGALAVAAGNIWFTRRLLARIWPRRVSGIADLDNALPSIDGRAP